MQRTAPDHPSRELSQLPRADRDAAPGRHQPAQPRPSLVAGGPGVWRSDDAADHDHPQRVAYVGDDRRDHHGRAGCRGRHHPRDRRSGAFRHDDGHRGRAGDDGEAARRRGQPGRRQDPKGRDGRKQGSARPHDGGRGQDPHGDWHQRGQPQGCYRRGRGQDPDGGRQRRRGDARSGHQVGQPHRAHRAQHAGPGHGRPVERRDQGGLRIPSVGPRRHLGRRHQGGSEGYRGSSPGPQDPGAPGRLKSLTRTGLVTPEKVTRGLEQAVGDLVTKIRSHNPPIRWWTLCL